MLTNQQLKQMDISILVSILNTKLRDQYPDLASLCDDLDLDETMLINRLEKENASYSSITNQIRFNPTM